MTDNEIENIQTVDVIVTAESIDAHVMCLKENGYKVYNTLGKDLDIDYKIQLPKDVNIVTTEALEA